MRRVTVTPRVDWRPGIRKYPFGTAAAPAAAAWREDVRYEFSPQQIDLIESVADELHGMVREAVRVAVDRRLLARLGLRGEAARLVEAAWADYWRPFGINERAGGLVGRLALAYDGRDSLKLLGTNYDQPDGLFAASIVQGNWLEALYSGHDQFNGLHEALIERWEELAAAGPGREHLHLGCLTPDPVREGELIYLAATAAEAGIATTLLPLQDIVWDQGRFRDQGGAAIAWLLKLYPWEAMVDDSFAQHLRGAAMAVVEPVWRWPMANHALLALLWELYPGHPNLCRAALSEEGIGGGEALILRAAEGLDHAPTRLIEHGRITVGTGAFPEGPCLWMEAPPVFEQDGAHAVLHAWVVGDKCLGMSVRESADPRVGPEAAIVPHLFRD
ncbi:glutathionylspermidine synthase family protein [Azospirillum sp.]|uniref:glutathionylspermidine synthase family protein n=1 Tax=Azospirillum sp. TaxID=34012 RepID=UPI002D636152|nr:glutathionylspermidine synthase family protein [Azospirillum sp.]HYD70297.1 glutathionylspermidine synthase family protein [Azospirillum sp.]